MAAIPKLARTSTLSRLKNERISTEGGADLTHNPFTALSIGGGLPAGPSGTPVAENKPQKKHRERVDKFLAGFQTLRPVVLGVVHEFGDVVAGHVLGGIWSQ